MLVKVDLFNDLNRFRQSSCGVKFFCSKYLYYQFLSLVKFSSVDGSSTISPVFLFICFLFWLGLSLYFNTKLIYKKKLSKV